MTEQRNARTHREQLIARLLEARADEARSAEQRAAARKRQGVVIQALHADGLSYREIARLLGVSHPHILNIVRRSRTDD